MGDESCYLHHPLIDTSRLLYAYAKILTGGTRRSILFAFGPSLWQRMRVGLVSWLTDQITHRFWIRNRFRSIFMFDSRGKLGL